MMAMLGWMIKQIMHFVGLPKVEVQAQQIYKSKNVVAVFPWSGVSE